MRGTSLKYRCFSWGRTDSFAFGSEGGKIKVSPGPYPASKAPPAPCI